MPAEHGQRRLETMSQVARAGAGALDRPILSIEEVVDLLGQRHDLVGIIRRKSVAGARTDGTKALAHGLERPQADPHLQPCREQQGETQHDQ
jgi:hypothetical protein